MKTIIKFLSLIFVLSFLTIISQPIFAEEISSFNTQIIASKDGTMDITETIDYSFGDLSRHGIFRDIPKVAKVEDLFRVMEFEIKQVTRDGRPETYQDNSDASQLSIKIGDVDKTITGNHQYKISYLVRNGIGSNYDDHDEINWNVTGNKWNVPILHTSATISTDFGLIPNKAVCYSGEFGQTMQNCLISQNSQFSARNLSSYQGLTIVAGFPVNTFPKSVLQKQISESGSSEGVGQVNSSVLYMMTFLFIAVPILLNFVLAPFLLIWYFKRKNKKRFGPVSVNFDFPEDETGKKITPAEAGTIDNALLDQNDVVATIFDFAIRKLIKIEQVKEEKILGIFGGGDDYKFIKLKELTDGNDFEKTLWSKLFDNGEEIKISSLKNDFYATFSSLNDKIFKILVERNFYFKNPKLQRGLLLTGAIISFITLNLFLGAVLIFFYNKLIGRTAKGDEVDFKIDGLKLFLKNMSREHTWQAKNLITVEKYIPYAIALGYINEFMDELKAIYPDYQPNWYSGNLAFYAISSNLISSMSSNFTTHAPSSSSGFSGGGFSGGGGGGGGGGSW